MMRSITRLLAVLTFVGWTGAVNATLIDVTLIDNDGPQIVGQVDTTADTFSVTSWVEGVGGAQYWTPDLSGGPLNYTAKTIAGAVFDVPDNWNGVIDSTWGFISDLSNPAILWNEGIYTGQAHHNGWGAGISPNITANGGRVVSFAENRFLWTPASASGYDSPFFDAMTIVEATQVSEPTTIALFGLSVVGLGFARRKREQYS